MCASGLESIMIAARRILLGETDTAVAGGTESMSNYPFLVRKARFGYKLGHGTLEDALIFALNDPFDRVHMGITAENVAREYGIPRDRQDAFALESQHRTAAAQAAGVFETEIVPIEVELGRGRTAVFREDEHPRPDTSAEKLAALKPAFADEGTVTAGNASGINDGAAALVLMSRRKAEALGLEPLARIVASAVRGVEPRLMGTGPIPAVRALLAQTGIDLEQIEIIELNEAFAAQCLACIDALDLNPDRVNPNGGAISLGHPVGATGSILAVKVLHALQRTGGRLGLVTLCVGGGQGMAVLLERQ
jgi:acetyl-CoA C-acetyltransferase